MKNLEYIHYQLYIFVSTLALILTSIFSITQGGVVSSNFTNYFELFCCSDFRTASSSREYLRVENDAL